MVKIKVIHIWKDFDTYYGVHDQLLSLARYINRDEFDFSICIFNYKGNALGAEFKKLNVPIHDLKMSSQKSPMVILRLTQFLKKEKPHIIQTYCLNTNIYGGISGRLAKVPIIIPTELTLKDQAPSKIKRIRDRLLFPLNTLLYFFSDSVVFVSKNVKEKWIGRRESDKYRIINPPFNYEKYKNIEKSEAKSINCRDEYTIGIVARLSEEKRHVDLIDAMPEILKKFPKLKLLIVGAGPLEYQIKKNVKQLNLIDSINFTGHKKNVFEELNKMNLFVLPSRSEGLGIAIIEAMVMGLPVVATHVGGIPEVVIDGETGILVPQKKPSFLADAIINLLSNPTKAKKMGERGKKRAFKIFHPKEFAKKHEELYKELFRKKFASRKSD